MTTSWQFVECLGSRQRLGFHQQSSSPPIPASRTLCWDTRLGQPSNGEARRRDVCIGGQLTWVFSIRTAPHSVNDGV